MKRICTVTMAVLSFASTRQMLHFILALLGALPLVSHAQPSNSNNNSSNLIPELVFQSILVSGNGKKEDSNFQGRVNNNKASLQWTVVENETGNSMELEKSFDGIHFTTAALIFTTTKTGTENYSYKESMDKTSFYRLKMINKDNSTSYSNVIRLTAGNDPADHQIRVLQNPVSSSLQFTYTGLTDKASTLNIYTASGVKIFSTQMKCQKEINAYQINLKQNIGPGIYLLEIINSHERSVSRFMKQ